MLNLNFFRRSRRFLKERRNELRKCIRKFNRDYDSRVSQYFNEIATEEKIIDAGKDRSITHEERQMIYIFSEQIKTQSERLGNFLKFLQESIINFEKELTNTKLLYVTYLLFAVGIIQIIPFAIKLIKFFGRFFLEFIKEICKFCL